jgi:hypothetical protein
VTGCFAKLRVNEEAVKGGSVSEKKGFWCDCRFKIQADLLYRINYCYLRSSETAAILLNGNKKRAKYVLF